MEKEILTTIGAILGLLVLSAFFSGAETSLTAASIPRTHTLARQGDHRAELVNELWSRKERLVGVILLDHNLINIMASDGCKGDTTPLAVGKWYEFREFGCHLGNVGSEKMMISFFPTASCQILHSKMKVALLGAFG